MALKRGMDLVVDQFLQDYSRKRKIIEPNKPRLFAQCAVDTVVLRTVRNDYNARDVFVDGQNDIGLDGIAIVVNNQIISTIEELERIISEDRVLDVRFVFVQATMDREFRAQKMDSFAMGVLRFFQNDLRGPVNDAVLHAFDLKQSIFERSEWLRSGRPAVQLYYVSTGQWVGDEVLRGSIISAEDLLEKTGLFSEVQFVPVDFRDFIDLKRNLQRRNMSEVHSYRLRELPQTAGVAHAFLGALLVDDLLNIISHPMVDRINRNVFIENVRGFQGINNPVNSGINETLNRDDATIFPLLNNGITIVCRDHESAGPNLRIFDYQIVNGCQTSTVIFANRKNLVGRDILVPVKIVVTRDERIIENIIRASNSQTTVSEEHILSLLPFNRRLAEFYRAMVLNGTTERIYYDIREGEFSRQTRLDSDRIVHIRDQIQCFSSMFLARPHDVIDRLRDLRDLIPLRIFNPDHALEPYYTSALAMLRFRLLRDAHEIDSIFENFRFHFLYVLRLKLFPRDFSPSNWRHAPILCHDVNRILMDPEKSLALYAEVGEIIRGAANMLDVDLSRDVALRKPFTEAIEEVLHSRGSVYRGK